MILFLRNFRTEIELVGVDDVLLVVGVSVGVSVELTLKLLVLIRIIKANIYSYSIYVFEYSALLRKRNIFFVFCYFFQSSSLVKKEYLKPENGLF